MRNVTFSGPDGQPIRVQVANPNAERTTVAVDGGAPLDVVILYWAGAEIRLQIGGQIYRGRAAQHGDEIFVYVAGHQMHLKRARGQVRQADIRSHADEIIAPMPGQVTQVFVAPGDHLQAGQALLVLEAMKMEMRVSAPRAGQLKRLACAPGDTVQKGQGLAELEP
ncbi:MAG: acetyl-CoA carboxylase biotin carboxyl carrier protein subunit [Anaerolineales bacterium]